ncbi:MAG: YigZ family protein [Clostridiaceae bacterium]
MQNTQGVTPYKTVRGAGESEIVISKSRFLGYCFPIASESEAAERLAEIKKRHWDARHVCYAFRLIGGISRSTDDGEPSGTAGAPILNALTQSGLENALCAVVRYFGGVLLGTGGLVRAYGKTASEAIVNAGTLSFRVCEQVRIRVTYPSYAALETFLKTLPYPCELDFGEHVALLCTVPAENAESFLRTVADKTDGSAQIELLERKLCAV